MHVQKFTAHILTPSKYTSHTLFLTAKSLSILLSRRKKEQHQNFTAVNFLVCFQQTVASNCQLNSVIRDITPALRPFYFFPIAID